MSLRLFSMLIIFSTLISQAAEIIDNSTLPNHNSRQNKAMLDNLAIELLRELPPECQSNAGFKDQDGKSIIIAQSHNAYWMDWMLDLSNTVQGFRKTNESTSFSPLEEQELTHIADCFMQYHDVIKANDTHKRITLFIPQNFSDVQDLIDPISFIFANINNLLLKKCAPDVVASRFRSYVYGDLEQGRRPIMLAVQQEIMNQIEEYKEDAIYPYIKHLEDIIDHEKLEAFKVELAKMLPQEEQTLSVFSEQIAAYKAFVQTKLIPHASVKNGLPKPIYELLLRINGVHQKPEAPLDVDTLTTKKVPCAVVSYESDLCTMLIKQGVADFELLYPQYISLANEIAATKNDTKRYPQNNPGIVIRNLMEDSSLKTQEEIVSMYHEVQEELENWIREDDFITLPDRPLRMRLGTPAEEASFPVPHVNTPCMIDNKGQKDEEYPEFVLCNALGNASPVGAYALSAHEGRPGHDLQFSSIVTQTVEGRMNLLESVLSSNSTNAEGWAHYVEYCMAKHYTSQARLAAMQDQLMRVCRTFLDPEINLGLISHEEVVEFYKEQLGLDAVAAKSEADRYSFLLPGQAVTYRFGALKISALYGKLERKLGDRFNTRRFHDALLSFGLLPLDLTAQFIKGRL